MIPVVKGWRALDDPYFSDHNYILFCLGETIPESAQYTIHREVDVTSFVDTISDTLKRLALTQRSVVKFNTRSRGT